MAKAVAAATYFFDSYCSSQRGTNENTNGLIRQYFPKGTEFRQITDTEVQRVVKKLNDSPESDSATGHRHRSSWGNILEP
uniref:hypothetical protein n=1 Tax=Halomonas piscis TaxID=3031727 RepID=UPI0035DBD964